MLHAVSWAMFFKVLLCTAALYYFVIGLLFYRKDLAALIRKARRPMMALVPVALMGKAAWAQTADPTNGINQANTTVRGLFDVVANLMYAVGGILALVGAIRVFQHLNDHRRQDAYAAAVAWLGSVIFLVIVATVIKAFFGLQ